MSGQKQADLRVCASCEWVFARSETDVTILGCPKCGFSSYGARYVYGDKAYRYKRTQEPWLTRQVAGYKMMLIKENNLVDRWPVSRRNAIPVCGFCDRTGHDTSVCPDLAKASIVLDDRSRKG